MTGLNILSGFSIDDSNKYAHHGDAVVDARLWEVGGCTGKGIYQELYDFEFTQVLDYCLKNKDTSLILGER